MNRKDKLTEATLKALRGKLDEVYIKQYVETFDELYDSSWGPAIEVLDKIAENDLEDELMNWLEDLGTEDAPIDRTDLNDYIIFQSEDIYDALGLDENGDPLDESKKLEARNPENNEINTKIRKSLNGSTKYIDDLKNAGLEVFQDDKGKISAIGSPNNNGMVKADLKNSHPDTDYYNYMTKKRVAPEVTDTGAFAPTNVFRDSNNFKSTISQTDRTTYRTDRNGVSKAIPKKYKTGRKNYNYNPDEFPRKDYNGVASYEPLDNQELKDFKYNKSKVSDGGWLKQDLDKAKAEYDQAKAEYDKVNDQVQSVRDKIAKSKANRKAEARSHKEDNEKVAPRKDYEKEYMQNNANISWYDDSKFDIEDFKKPINAKRNKLNKPQNGKITHGSYEKSPNKQTQLYKDLKALGYIESNKKVTEATTDVNEVVDEYKEAYHKDLDLKTVPCVIARDKMLSGWGGAEGKTHYQVVLCADSNEAYNIAHNMQSKAKQEQLANVRVSYGVKLPSRASVAYCVGRDASAWNMGDSWYERYDTKKEENKKTENKKDKKQEGRFNPNSENPEIRMKNYKLMLKRALGTDYEVVGKQGYRYYSGFVKNNKNGKCAYYSINQDWNGKDETDNILIRTAKDFKDYTGGSNKYTDIDNFVKDISRLVESTPLSRKIRK